MGRRGLTSPEPVEDLELTAPLTVDRLVRMMGKGGGFVGRYLAEGVDVLESMIKDRRCIKFLSFPAAIVATGVRGVIREFLKRSLFDVVVTTVGTLDHDLARCWGQYLKGDFRLSDVQLKRRGLHRVGSVLVPRDVYGPVLEARLQPFLEDLYRQGVREVTVSELVSRLGEFVKDERSLLYWAWRNRIPFIIPGPTDGAVGSQLWLFTQRHRDFKLDLMRDQDLVAELVFNAKATGALIIGGGISKHHTLWWNQFRGGLDYVVYLTTAVEYDGSLSGAEPREAISWLKLRERARRVLIHAEATVALPVIGAALLERLR
jgi:deoxyhypusine synthase